MYRSKTLFSAVCVLLVSQLLIWPSLSIAAASSPAGLWKTIDDNTGKPRSLVRINEANGVVTAVVEKGLLETDTGDKICDKCKDDRKGQRIIGMEIIRDMKQHGKRYDGGTILDPENGKTYQCILKLNETGDELEVRGFIGISLIGRSQIWHRVE